VAPKVYVTQRKSAASSKQTNAADFRWGAPTSVNGILEEQHVFYWRSSAPDQVTTATLSPSARHFILDDLQGNITYFFQVGGERWPWDNEWRFHICINRRAF